MTQPSDQPNLWCYILEFNVFKKGLGCSLFVSFLISSICCACNLSFPFHNWFVGMSFHVNIYSTSRFTKVYSSSSMFSFYFQKLISHSCFSSFVSSKCFTSSTYKDRSTDESWYTFTSVEFAFIARCHTSFLDKTKPWLNIYMKVENEFTIFINIIRSSVLFKVYEFISS